MSLALGAIGLVVALGALAGPPPLQLTAAVSRLTHGLAGNLDVDLLVPGVPAVECHGPGPTTLVMTFTNPVVSGNAIVTNGIGTVASTTFSNNTMTANLTGVADVQTITIVLSNVTDTFSQVLPNTAFNVSVLGGDTNGDGIVDVLDRQQTQSRAGQTANATNFRSDVTSLTGSSRLRQYQQHGLGIRSN